MSREPFYVATNSLVVRGGKILLGKRKGGFGDGLWGIPGGHIERGEKMIDAVARELEEETGISSANFSLSNVLYTQDSPKDVPYIHMCFLVESIGNEPEVKEPNKCEEWKWFDFDNLPKKIVESHKQQIDAYKEKRLLTDLNNK